MKRRQGPCRLTDSTGAGACADTGGSLRRRGAGADACQAGPAYYVRAELPGGGRNFSVAGNWLAGNWRKGNIQTHWYSGLPVGFVL